MTKLSFLDPLDHIEWAKALAAKRTEFTARSGLKLTLDYDKRPGWVWFKAVDSIAPCGWSEL